MAEFVTKSCPRCGKRPLDPRLEQCPYCGVPFELVPTSLSPEQLTAVTRHILRSGKFWAVVIALLAVVTAVLAGLIHWENGHVTDNVARNSSNQIAAVTGSISKQISSQIAAEFEQPRIQATIESVASQKASQSISNAVWGSLEAFRTEVREAQVQLIRTKGDLAALSNDLVTAQIAAQHVLSTVSNQPPYLQLVDQAVNFNGSNFVLALSFKPSNSNPVGQVDLAAGTYRQTARILAFTAHNVESVAEPTINAAGDGAVLHFTANKVDGLVIIELVFSDATIVRLESDTLEAPLTLPVAVDQMRLPRASR